MTWTHPSQRRFRTAMSLTGERLVQEVAGVQRQETVQMLATHQDYVDVLRQLEATEFVDELQIQAQQQIADGYECFQVSASGSRKMLPGITEDGSYLYEVF